jgi:hypothetical protein
MEWVVFLMLVAVVFGVSRAIVDKFFPTVTLRGKKPTPLLGVVKPDDKSQKRKKGTRK